MPNATTTPHDPAEFAAHVIDALLYSNCVDECTDEHARMRRVPWAAASSVHAHALSAACGLTSS